MRAGSAVFSLVIVLAIGYYLYQSQLAPVPGEKVSPVERIDVTGVKSDLLGIAQAERLYLAGHGNYATLEELQQDGAITFTTSNRRGYNFVAEISSASHFKVTARPADPARARWPSLSIDETMEISSQ